jgi:hypothetical protein
VTPGQERESTAAAVILPAPTFAAFDLDAHFLADLSALPVFCKSPPRERLCVWII